VIYLDTGCLVKLYYPEPNSPRIAQLVSGKTICFTPLHRLEFTNALSLKMFFQSATSAQVQSATDLVDADLQSGVLHRTTSNWETIFEAAAKLSKLHSFSIGCRSMDVLHCAAAQVLEAMEFVTTDQRQKRLAVAIGLNVVET